MMIFTRTHQYGHIFLCNRWQVEVCPSTGFQEVTRQVLFMQSLLDDDDHVGLFVVEARYQGIPKPVNHVLPFDLGFNFIRLMRIVNNDQITCGSR